MIVQPRLYYQGSDATTRGNAANTALDGSTLGAANSRSGETVDGNNLSLRTTLRHRFARPGRNISADLNFGHALRVGDGTQYALTDSYDGATIASDTLDQRANSHTLTQSFSGRVAYTEKLTERFRLQAIWNPAVPRGSGAS